MPDKDTTEKILESYNDVFADIINGLLFNGEERVKPENLSEDLVRAQYRAEGGRIREQERDVLKRWSDCGIDFAICGIENQTRPERFMPMRIIGYDGATYRGQLLKRDKKPVPVVTIVLYFGTKSRWNGTKSLKSLFDIPEGLEEYVNDYRIHVFDIAWLSEEQINKFHSDFKIVAEFFMKKRTIKDYVPDNPQEIKHVDEVLKLLSAMSGDSCYVSIPNKEEVKSMCDVAERLVKKGLEQGRSEGRDDERVALTEAYADYNAGVSVKKLEEKYGKATIDLMLLLVNKK